MSADVPHRSDVGAVQLGIKDEAGLRAAIALIEKNVREKVPGAVIEGYELQEELIDCLQAMVGYQAAPPYGALTIVGSGGVLVELEADKALSLSPVTVQEAAGSMLAGTRLGKTMGGYRNLIPLTDTAPLARLVANLSELAADFCDLVPGVRSQPGADPQGIRRRACRRCAVRRRRSVKWREDAQRREARLLADGGVARDAPRSAGRFCNDRPAANSAATRAVSDQSCRSRNAMSLG